MKTLRKHECSIFAVTATLEVLHGEDVGSLYLYGLLYFFVFIFFFKLLFHIY